MSIHEAASSARRPSRPGVRPARTRPSAFRPTGRLGIILLATTLVTLPAASPASADPAPADAPLLAIAGQAVPGQYIVVLKGASATATTASTARTHTLSTLRNRGGRVIHTYGTALNGFAAALTATQLAAVRADANVAYVVPDGVVTASATQTGATWGLDRIDQRARPLNGSYTYGPTAGNVTAYVIDSGIRTTHAQFGGRASGGFTTVNDGRGASDCFGHGTHVAATIGGSTYGVAKGVKLVAVRVLNCVGDGSVSGTIAGVDWV